MENTELQQVWKSMGNKLPEYSKEELHILLGGKSKQTVNRFIVSMAISGTVSVGVVLYLIVTSLNRPDDRWLLLNNLVLGITTLIALTSAFWSVYRLGKGNFGASLREWLKERIDLLDRWLNGPSSMISWFIVPFLYVMLVLSIHVYGSGEPFAALLHNSESLYGLAFSMPVGIAVAYWAMAKIRRQYKKDLRFMKDLYLRICSED
ncbi:MAG: hypothetical protein ACOYXB_16865 [Bacteroidota bacterium]